MKTAFLVLCSLGFTAWAQEADSGVSLNGTVSVLAAGAHEATEQPRDGSPLLAGFRAVLYPTWKLNEHWTVTGAVQVHSRPYFSDEFSTQGYGVKTDILQAYLSYSRSWKDRSLVIRVGQLSTAFGSFLLRYDDAVNPLVDKPLSYGYYGGGVSLQGFVGAEADVTLGKLDARAQFVNSSPANRRTIYERDQYGNWAGGVGYTIKQGFRIGASTYHGPYLDRQFAFYFPGEAPPRDLPATAVGIDAQWGHGPWSLYGEWQRFQFDYRVIPTFIEKVGYVEARRTLAPRWYVAARVGYLRANAFPGQQAYEAAVGYRPSRFQLIKIGYEVQQSQIKAPLESTVFVQLVTTFGPLSLAHN